MANKLPFILDSILNVEDFANKAIGKKGKPLTVK